LQKVEDLTASDPASIAPIDKYEIGSQTSSRAAGMVSSVRKGDLMITLTKDACRRIECFTE